MNTTGDAVFSLTNSESNAIKYVRAIATILIVACHYLQTCGNRWCSVINIGVQIFFVMSGYLFGCQNINNWGGWFYKRWRKLYIPFIIFVTLVIGSLLLFRIQYVGIPSIIKYVYLCHGFLGDDVKGLGHLWFITAIFACYWITPILQFITTRKNGSSISGLLVLLLGLFSFLFFITYNISFSWEYSWFFNYIVGYLLAKSTLKFRFSYLICSVVFLVWIVFSITWEDIATYSSLNNGLHSFGAHVFFLLFVLCASKLTFKTLIKPLGIIEKYSLFIYLVHYPFTRMPWSLVGITYSWILDIIIIIVTITVATSIIFVLNKIIGKMVDIIIP